LQFLIGELNAVFVVQVAAVCVQCGQLSTQDDSRLLCAAREIKEALDLVEQQQQQFSELSPEQVQPDASIPITFTKVNILKFAK
jgi:hypothetical protein